MKFYVSTAFDNQGQQQELARALQGLGSAWRQTYDWTQNARARDDEAAEEKMAEVTREEIAGILDAELFVVLLPGGRGTHVELGVALGVNAGEDVWVYRAEPWPMKKIVLWSWDGSHFAAEGRSAFYFAPGVERVTGPLSELITYLS